LAEAISIESGELLENFLWMTVPQARELNDSEIHRIEQEIADIFIYLVYLCDELGLDVLEATTKKLKINENRFPPENFGMIKK
jgi:NTP pyrophosphatase (non-canonical NTP hydrolase)